MRCWTSLHEDVATGVLVAQPDLRLITCAASYVARLKFQMRLHMSDKHVSDTKRLVHCQLYVKKVICKAIFVWNADLT